MSAINQQHQHNHNLQHQHQHQHPSENLTCFENELASRSDDFLVQANHIDHGNHDYSHVDGIFSAPATCEMCGQWLPNHTGQCPRNGLPPDQWALYPGLS